MTVNEAIEIACPSFPSELERTELIKRLSELECRIATELFGKKSSEPEGLTVLLAPDAYAEVYPVYLMMRRELDCGDEGRYALYRRAFEDAYARLAAYASRSVLRAASAIKLLGD